MIDDADIRKRLQAADALDVGPQENPSPSHRRGSEDFYQLLKEMAREWEFDEEELDNIVEIRRAGDSFEVRYKGESEWEYLEEGDEEDDDRGEDFDADDFDGEEE